MSSTAPSIQETDLSIGGPADRWNRRDRIFIGLLAICTFALYLRTGHFDFIGYDDQIYVYSNPHVVHVTLDSFRWAMTAVVSSNWHPLTILVELIISLVFGPTPAAFHLTNSVLHAVNVVLLYVLLRSCTGRSWASFFTAALWGLHPLRVESVAWISELKDVLCGALSLGCLLAYVRYSRHRTIGAYGIVLLLFVLALLAKPMAATLPGVMLLMDYWPLNRTGGKINTKSTGWWRKRVLEKLLLLAFAAADMAYALYTQRTVITHFSALFPVQIRIKNALISTVDYLRDIFFPYHLAIFYPHPAMIGQTISLGTAILCGAFLLLITCVLVLRTRTQPYLLVGWLWFLGMLVPVIGFVQLGVQSMADRYTYLPTIGIMIALVWWVSDLTSKRRIYQITAGVVGTIAAAALAASSVFTIGHWQNTTTLFEYARHVVPNNYLAVAFHSTERRLSGDTAEAIIAGKEAITLAPKNAAAREQYALALSDAGRLDEAVDQITQSLSLDPDDYEAWDAFGRIRDLQADRCAANHQPGEREYREKSIIDLKCAVFCDPDDVPAEDHLAYQLAVLGQLDDAIAIWQHVLDQLPSDGMAQGELADALRLKGDLPDAVAHYQAALALGSKNPDWESKLAYLVATNPQATSAQIEPMVAIAKDACDQTNNRSPAALDAYAACLARVGRFDDAVSVAQQAVAQANADHTPSVAQGIQKRLSRYQRQLSYVAGDD